MSTNDKKQDRNIVHVHAGDDLVVHWEGGLVLLSAIRLDGYYASMRPDFPSSSKSTVTLSGISLRTVSEGRGLEA